MVFKPEINNGGGTNDLLPITLIKGDNGEYGIDVFNYLYDIVQTRGEFNSCDLLENEYITVGEYTFTSIYRPSETAIALNPIPSGYLTVVLINDGNLYMTLD